MNVGNFGPNHVKSLKGEEGGKKPRQFSCQWELCWGAGEAGIKEMGPHLVGLTVEKEEIGR